MDIHYGSEEGDKKETWTADRKRRGLNFLEFISSLIPKVTENDIDPEKERTSSAISLSARGRIRKRNDRMYTDYSRFRGEESGRDGAEPALGAFSLR